MPESPEEAVTEQDHYTLVFTPPDEEAFEAGKRMAAQMLRGQADD